MSRANRDEAAALVRRALALALERPSLLDAHDAAIRAALPACPAPLAAIYERFRAESAAKAIATLGEPDGDDVASAVGEWASASGNGVAAEWCAVLDLRPPPMKVSDTERELRALTKRLAVAGDDSPIVTCLNDVEPREIAWLWPGRVPLGRITLLVGRPGEGKSFLAVDMAAHVSTGTPWPDGSDCPRGSVLLLSAEDDPGDTIRPRLDAAEADCRRVHLLSGVRRIDADGERERLLTLADVDAIEAALAKLPDCRLVVIDPIGSYLGGGTDAHRDNEVRSVLAPIAALAEKHGVAVLVVAHRRKSGSAIADDTVTGSRAFTGIARAVWHLTRDPDNKSRRLLLPGKNNLAREGDGLALSIIGEPPRIAWETEPVKMHADDAFAAEQAASVRKPGPPDETLRGAEVWLAAALADGPRLAKELFDEWCNAHGGSKRTLYRAKEKLNVEAFRETIPGPWFWRTNGTIDATFSNIANQGCQSPRGEDLGNLGNLAKNTGFLPLFDADEPKVAKLSELGGLGPDSIPIGGAA